jgi:hypothetical protein
VSRPAAILLVLAAAASAWLAPASEPPLTDEEVVRLHVSGIPAASIVERIRASAVEFDLSEEMVVELRRAGLPEEVLAAMRERQAEVDRARAPAERAAPPGPEPGAGLASLRIALEATGGAPGGDGPARLRLAAALPEPLAGDVLGSGGTTTATGLAVFVACVSATHVPDHWRDRSPLGRDFLSMPRHRLLAFVATATVAPAGPTLELELPPRLEAEVGVDEPHDLVLGIAVEAGGRWLRLTDDRRDGVSVPLEGLELRARVGGGGASGQGMPAIAFD